ncbi:MAG: hypothetical protein WCI75_15325 [candidate division NC10 bacterium]
MNARQALILAAIFAVGIAGAAALRKHGARGVLQAPADGWAQYEGPFVRFRYPGDWKAAHWIAKKTGERNWAVFPPSYLKDKDDAGVVNINCYPGREEKRPLDQVFDIKEWSGHKPAGQPRKIEVKNGRCIAYPLEESKDPGAVSKIHAYCAGMDGLLYDVWAVIGVYMREGRPTDDVRRNARIYEKLLASLEFL